MAAIRHKLSARPTSGTPSAFSTRAGVVLLLKTFASIRPSLFPAPSIRVARYQGKNWFLPTKDGGILRTIRDACNYMTGIGKQRELRSHWQRACKLILAKEDVLTVSRALFYDAQLDVSKIGGT
jgi:hypothetical protein